MNAKHLAAVAVATLAVTLISCNKSNEPAANNAPQAGTPSAAVPEQPPAAAPAQPPAAAQAPSRPSAVAPSRPEGRRSARDTSPSDAAAPSRRSAAAENAPPAPPQPRRITVPEGTSLRVRTTSTITTKTAEAGTPFAGSLAEPLVVNGSEIAPRGARVDGRVVESDPGGRVRGVAHLTVQLTALQVDGKSVPISTATVAQEAPTSKKKDAAKVGIGAGIGAAIGAIAGGGRGAAIGAGAGGAAGTAGALATRGDPAVIPAESVLTFTLAAPVTVTQ